MCHLEPLLEQRLPKELGWRAYRLEVVSLASAGPMEQLYRWSCSYPHLRLKKLAVAAHARLILWMWRPRGLAPT